jgi:hypothetical protein
MKSRAHIGGLALAGLLFFATAADAQTPEMTGNSASIHYADLADLALAAPIALVATVHDTVKLKGADATGVAPGFVRFYIQGDTNALIAGKGGLPAGISWLADVPMVSNRPPKLKNQKLILLARPTPGRPGVLQLITKGSQFVWTPELEQRLRAILTEQNSGKAPPVITGVGHAFHTAGSIPGEGETQIFLKTADNRPVSLDIQRHPGEDTRWSVSLGDIVDDSAGPPQRDTLLWYRLACGLPAQLPDDALADQQPEDAQQARTDYKLVLDRLGPCGRTLAGAAN